MTKSSKSIDSLQDMSYDCYVTNVLKGGEVMSKTVIENLYTHDKDIVDGDTGEVIKREHTEETGLKIIHKQEPSYIKLYLDDVLYLHDIPKGLSSLMYELLKRATYANEDEALCVGLNSYLKEKICEKLGYKNNRTLDNYIYKLKKGKVIKEIGYNTYQFNPYLFGKGEWKDIENIRMTWDYNEIKGKTFSTSFTYKTETDGQITMDFTHTEQEKEAI